MMIRYATALFCALSLAACGGNGSDDNNSNKGNNGAPNNGASNNGASNNGASNNGVSNNGASNNGASNNGASNNGANNGAGPTYHADVRPIIEAECSQCHFDGGIGPFPLTTYDEVSSVAALVASAVNNGTMPPWPPSEDCGGPFKYERRLTDEQKATITDWVTAGTPEGNEADYVPPDDLDGVDLGDVDHTIDIGQDYVATPRNSGIDDYHCFIVEHDMTEDAYLQGYQVRPGNPATVHHVLFWQVSNDELANVRAKEETPGAGYTCFGGSGTSEEGLLGVWAPGAQPMQFQDGTGFRIPKDSFFVVQVHYNTLNGTEPDRTNVDLYFTDSTPQVPLGMYPLADTGISIPAGQVDDKSNMGDSRGQFRFTLPIGVPVFGVVPHMHTLGTRIRVEAGDHCLVDIPEWDFNWQGLYLFETPVQLQRNDEVRLNCWYDNSMANQQPGQTPRDVTWGDGTFDEMCLNYVIIRELPI